MSFFLELQLGKKQWTIFLMVGNLEFAMSSRRRDVFVWVWEDWMRENEIRAGAPTWLTWVTTRISDRFYLHKAHVNLRTLLGLCLQIPFFVSVLQERDKNVFIWWHLMSLEELGVHNISPRTCLFIQDVPPPAGVARIVWLVELSKETSSLTVFLSAGSHP